MSFHFSNFGAFANELQAYADLDGFVPEAGDDWAELRWDAAIEWDDDAWQEHVCGAVRATVRAEKSLDAWREGRVDDGDHDQEDGDQPEAVATIELDGGRRGTIRVHQEDGQWFVTCAGQDGVEIDACIAPQDSLDEALAAIGTAWGSACWDLCWT